MAMALTEIKGLFSGNLKYLNNHGVKIDEQALLSLLKGYSNSFQLRFLMKLLSNRYSDASSLLQQAKLLNVDIEGPWFSVFVLEIQSPVSSFLHDILFHMLLDSVIREMANRKLNAHYCIDSAAHLCCIVDSHQDEVSDLLEEALNCVVTQIQQQSDIAILYGIGKTVDSICDIPESLDSAVQAVQNKRSAQLNIPDATDGVEDRHMDADKIQAYLLECFHDGDLPKIESAIHEHIIYLYDNAGKNSPMADRFLFTYMQNITKECMRLGVTPERFESYVPAVVNLMQSDIPGTAEAVIHLSEQILKHLSVHRTSESNHLLNMAKDYIRDHLGDERLDLEAVSNHVGLSRVYFCKLFHQLEGISFNAYLKNERIEKAKQLLLTTNMKVYEISNAVGFSHAKYFGHVFKQTVGMTPVEFQRSNHK